jgi:hypothetical protein
MNPMKKISCFVVFLLLAALISAPFWPWNMWIYDAIQSQLAKKKLAIEFTVDNAFPGTLILKNIRIKNSDIAFDALEIHYNARELFSKRLDLQSAVLRSKDGEFSLQPVKTDMFRPSTIDMAIDVKNVPLGVIMKLLTADRADATGTVSGVLPLTYHADGTFTLRSAKLGTNQPGTLSVAPSAIPGDNDQIQLVRDALKDFHYQEFSLALESGKGDKLSMLLQLRGNNPAVYNGREIILNVRLQGDLLETLQQSILSIDDPKQLLEQKR